MPIERIPGVPWCGFGLEPFPAGCACFVASVQACTGQLTGAACRLCRRAGKFPPPAWWSGDCPAPSLDRPSVQVIAWRNHRLPWAAASFIRERYLDGRFPIVAATSAPEALALAHARAAQMAELSDLERGGRPPGQARRVTVIARAGCETDIERQ